MKDPGIGPGQLDDDTFSGGPCVPADWHDVPDGGHAFIAGWEPYPGGDWRDVENGEEPFEDSAVGWEDIERVTVHYINADTGADVYFTVWGPFADWDSFMMIVDDAADNYAG